MDTNNVKDFKKVIDDIIDVRLKQKGITQYISAKIKSQNIDGSYSVYLLPDNREISSVLNKTGEILSSGDSVEICMKNGKINNAWIAIKHKTNFVASGFDYDVDTLIKNKANYVPTPQYFLLARLPISNDGNGETIRINGYFGSWVSAGKVLIDVIIANRDGLNAYGTYIGTRSGLKTCNIQIYQQDDGILNIYMVINEEWVGDINLSVYGSNDLLVCSDSNSAPVGTLVKTIDYSNLFHLDKEMVIENGVSKNLLPPIFSRYLWLDKDTGNTHVSEKVRDIVSWYVPVKPNTQYTFSPANTNIWISIHGYNSSQGHTRCILDTSSPTSPTIFTTNGDERYLRFAINDGEHINRIYQLEEGSVATDIVPYFNIQELNALFSDKSSDIFNGDLNNINVSGVYNFYPGSGHSPKTQLSGFAEYGQIIVMGGHRGINADNTWIQQIAMGNYGDNKMAIRNSTDDGQTWTDWSLQVTLRDTGWVDVPLATDASTLDWCKFQYRKLNGTVFINGIFKLLTPHWSKTIGQLPNGFRPFHESDFVCRGVDNSPVVIAIGPEGQINFLDTVNGVYSAEFVGGIITASFIADN